MRTFLCALTLAAALVAGVSRAAASTPSDLSDPQAVDPPPPGCAVGLEATFWGGREQLLLAQALAAHRSPCVEYTVTVPPQPRRTNLLGPLRYEEIRVLGVTPLAEIHWGSPTGWRAWVVGGHPEWMPGRTFYEAGVTARQRMAMRGLDVAAGETWAFNELTTEVLEGAPGARAEVLEFLRGLYDGAPGMPQARGLVFNVFVPSNAAAGEVAAYKEKLRAWLADEPFWTELDRYVDVFANEVYPSTLSWGVEGVSLAQRTRRLNHYFHHMTLLSEDAPKGMEAARTFLRRTYLPLANAFWPSAIGDTDLLEIDEMKSFVSAQVYALRLYADEEPDNAPRGLGFGWAPLGTEESLGPQWAALAERLAEAVRASTAGPASTPKDACGPPEARIWCRGDVDGAQLTKEWATFADWD